MEAALPEKRPLQAGVTVSSRYFKKAVDRNRVKRLLREAWRLQKAPLESCIRSGEKQLALFILFTGKQLPEYTEIMAAMAKAVEKLLRDCKCIQA